MALYLTFNYQQPSIGPSRYSFDPTGPSRVFLRARQFCPYIQLLSAIPVLPYSYNGTSGLLFQSHSCVLSISSVSCSGLFNPLHYFLCCSSSHSTDRIPRTTSFPPALTEIFWRSKLSHFLHSMLIIVRFCISLYASTRPTGTDTNSALTAGAAIALSCNTVLFHYWQSIVRVEHPKSIINPL